MENRGIEGEREERKEDKRTEKRRWRTAGPQMRERGKV